MTDADLCGALDNLLGDYADNDRMSAHQEAYAEQAREYLTMAIDRLSALAAVVAAVHAALDQRNKDVWMGHRKWVVDDACVSAIAKAVER